MSGSADETITLARSHALRAASAVAELVIPRQLGPVRLIKEIGRGGMGSVYLGRDELLGRDVAVKFLIDVPASSDDPNFAGFLEGARAAAAVRHPNLTTIYQAGLVEGVPHIVMQYVDGPTVAQVVARNGRLSATNTMTILRAAADAIGELHERQIVHRDIKPSNLLLDADGNVYVTDFGLAHRRAAPVPGASGGPSAGWSGTPAYMAPEMFDGEVSLRTDVYALGIMAYELLAGELPFKAPLDEIRQKHAQAPLPPGPLKRVRVSPQMIEVLERATHKSAVFRYKTARQFLRALDDAAQQGAREARAPQAGPAGDSRGVEVALWQLVVRTRAAPEPAAPLAAPEPAGRTIKAPISESYYNRLSRLVSTKRVETAPDDHAASAAPADADYCVCGYDRRGVDADAACPECGRPGTLDEEREGCARLARKPRRLVRRFLTLRPFPAGWWQLLDKPETAWFTPLRAWLCVVGSALLSALVLAAYYMLIWGLRAEYSAKSYLYRIGDPQQHKVEDYAAGSASYWLFDRNDSPSRRVVLPSSVKPGLAAHTDSTRRVVYHLPVPSAYLGLPLLLLPALLFPWPYYRYFYLRRLRRNDRAFTPEALHAMRRAGDSLAPLHLALALWQLAVLVVGLAMGFFTHAALLGEPLTWLNLWALVLAVYPALAWSRVISADPGHAVFRRRPAAIGAAGCLATALLIGAAIVISKRIGI